MNSFDSLEFSKSGALVRPHPPRDLALSKLELIKIILMSQSFRPRFRPSREEESEKLE